MEYTREIPAQCQPGLIMALAALYGNTSSQPHCMLRCEREFNLPAGQQVTCARAELGKVLCVTIPYHSFLSFVCLLHLFPLFHLNSRHEPMKEPDGKNNRWH